MWRVERALHRLRAEESGFSLVELLVAATIMAGGLAAVLGIFDGSRQLVTHAERNETASHQAEQELERILATDYGRLGHAASAPQPSSEPNHPDFFVQTGGTYRYDHRAGGQTEPLVASEGDRPRYREWVDGRLSGRVYSYFTWFHDPELVQTPTDLPDAKRVTVVATVEGGDERLKPVVTSSIVFDRGLQAP
jgi:prepilin-type N-terminal cleavage/methylation domain-containing protein